MVTSQNAHHPTIIHRRRLCGYRCGLLQVFNNIVVIIIMISVVVRPMNNDDALISVCSSFCFDSVVSCNLFWNQLERLSCTYLYIYTAATFIFFNIRYNGVFEIAIYWRLWIFIKFGEPVGSGWGGRGGGETAAAAQRNRYGREKLIYEREDGVDLAEFQRLVFNYFNFFRHLVFLLFFFRVNKPRVLVMIPAIPLPRYYPNGTRWPRVIRRLNAPTQSRVFRISFSHPPPPHHHFWTCQW